MFKFLIALAAALALVYFGLTFNGYQFNPKNISYYLPQKPSSAVELEFTNGSVIQGEILEETQDSIRVNMSGVITTFPRNQIKATHASASKDFFTQYLQTLRTQNKSHPLISKKKGTSAAAALDKGTTSALKTLTQVDKLEQMEKLKKDIAKIQEKQDERNKQLDDIMKG